MPLDKIEAWLKDVLPKHERLKRAAISLLENILKENAVEYLSVQGRVKEFDSALEKVGRKNYNDPEQQLTDLTGIRVVTFLENQVELVSKAIRRLFEIDEENSLDRAAILGNDKIGYRSTHFVCNLGKRRESLPEYEGLGSLKFEIQVRTVLQHAWAELAHDRSFKFAPGLPASIERKLNLYSGMLEVVDAGFDAISNEIDEYRKKLEKKTLSQISDVEISTLSLDKFVNDLSNRYGISVNYLSISREIIDELKTYGIENIGQLESIATDDFAEVLKDNIRKTTNIGLIRHIMLYNDIDKYFNGPAHWHEMSADTIEFLSHKYGRDKVVHLLKEHTKEIERTKSSKRSRKSPRP